MVVALGPLERPHIDVLHILAYEDPPIWSDQHDGPDKRDDGQPHAWFIDGLKKRLPHLEAVMPALELTLRTNGITWRTEGFGGPLTDVQLTALGRLCVDYLSVDPASTVNMAGEGQAAPV